MMAASEAEGFSAGQLPCRLITMKWRARAPDAGAAAMWIAGRAWIRCARTRIRDAIKKA